MTLCTAFIPEVIRMGQIMCMHATEVAGLQQDISLCNWLVMHRLIQSLT